MSPVYVEEFCTGILGAGTRLASLLKVEYLSAHLVSAALCDVSEVVEDYSMKGKGWRPGLAVPRMIFW